MFCAYNAIQPNALDLETRNQIYTYLKNDMKKSSTIPIQNARVPVAPS